MREIKFKQAIYLNGKFNRMHYYGFTNAGAFIGPVSPLDTALNNSMQYTGLKDKNGKEIYEGDIVTTGEGLGGFPPYDQTKPRIVEFRDGCWCFNAGRYDEGDWIRFGFWTASNEDRNQLHQMTVIGNIYETPELLEVTKP